MEANVQLNETHQALANRIIPEGTVDAHDVRALWREFYGDRDINREDAAFLFYLNQNTKNNDPSWKEFFVEALTDYFVWQNTPSGVVSVDDAHFLIESILHDDDIDIQTEFELLVNVVHHAESCPDEVGVLALESIKKTINKGGGVLFGPNRKRPGVIDDEDVMTIRKVVYGTGGDQGYMVSRAEADVLFELKEMTADKKNAEGWMPLFVQAVGHHVVHPLQPYRYDAEEKERRRAWLDERRGVTGLLGETVATIFKSRGEDPEVVPEQEVTEEEESLGLSEMLARHMAERTAIDAGEAEWLLSKIDPERELDEVEIALLSHIKALASQIHPSLEDLFAKAGTSEN